MKLGLSQSLGLFVGSLALASCAGSGISEPALGGIPIVMETHELVLPLDAYLYSPGQYLSVQRAAWQLTRECVERFGDEYTVSEPTVEGGVLEPFLFGNQRRYGLFDAESAAEHGYHVAEELFQGGGKGGWSPSQAELVLVRGSSGSSKPTDQTGQLLPDGGCGAEADRILDSGGPGPDQAADFGLPGSLATESHERSESDSRVRDVVDQWSECMERRGYDYGNVWEPNNQNWPEPVGEEEIAVATSDVACKQEVNLLGVWLAVETAYQKGAIQEHATELNPLRAKVATEAANAAQILDGE